MRVPARLLRATLPPWVPPGAMILAEHRAFIESLPCLGCGKPPPSEGAQVGRDGKVGIGMAGAERYLVLLCSPATVWQSCCHDRHYFDRARFWSGLGIDPRQLAIQLWRVSGNRSAGAHLIRHARQVILRHQATALHSVRRRDRAGEASRPPAWG